MIYGAAGNQIKLLMPFKLLYTTTLARLLGWVTFKPTRQLLRNTFLWPKATANDCCHPIPCYLEHEHKDKVWHSSVFTMQLPSNCINVPFSTIFSVLDACNENFYLLFLFLLFYLYYLNYLLIWILYFHYFYLISPQALMKLLWILCLDPRLYPSSLLNPKENHKRLRKQSLNSSPNRPTNREPGTKWEPLPTKGRQQCTARHLDCWKPEDLIQGQPSMLVCINQLLLALALIALTLALIASLALVSLALTLIALASLALALLASLDPVH